VGTKYPALQRQRARTEQIQGEFQQPAKAFLVVPLVGAFFIDIVNALVIKTFLALPLLQTGGS
jgi:ESS family glutamate:Na+ symporter